MFVPDLENFFQQYRIAIFLCTGIVMAGWFYNKYWINRRFYPSTQSMQGKTVLITGGNAGIGFETAKDLLRRGARVIIACRNMNKGREALVRLQNATDCDEKNVRLMECDLCSFDSVRTFARLYNEQEERLDVLICNAGLVYAPQIVSEDGWNYVMQANYLGHFLLTNLLLEKLKKCRPSRIINVSSIAHKYPPTTEGIKALTDFKTDAMWGAYPPSKACQILSSFKLKHDLLGSEGVNAFALNPGWVWTSFQDPLHQAIGFWSFLILYPLLRIAKFVLAKTPTTGARTTIYCAVEPSLDYSNDLYFENCAVSRPIPMCTDNALADQLWKTSCEAVGL